MLDSLGIDFPETTFYDLAGMPGSKVIREMVQHLSDDQIDRILHQREELFFESLPHIEPVSAVVEIARQHRGKLQMAVASGSIRKSVDRQLETIGVLHWFETVVAAEDTKKHKPEPDVFLEAAARMGVPPSACRVYEDSDLGLEACRRAGMEGVDVRPMYSA